MKLNKILSGCLVLLSVLAVSQSRAQEEINTEEILNHKWRISLNGGIGYRLASTKETKQVMINQGYAPSEVDNYFKSIKWGPKLSGQVHYLFNERYGVGIDYQFHQSSGTLSGTIDPGDGWTLYYGTMEDKVYTNYTGLSFYSNEWLVPNKLNFYAQTSVGITFFRQENLTLYAPVLLTGKALGVNLETGLEYSIQKNIALGFHLNYFQSTIKTITADDGTTTAEIELEKEMYEGLGRLDAGLGLRFYF